MEDYQKYLNQSILELRRGTLILSVLSVLNEPMYGYSLIQLLKEEGLSIDQSTLYPLLRRLEKQTFLKSEWSVEESRPRKYYSLTKDGKTFLIDLKREWEKSNKMIKNLLNKNNKEGK